jgi:hypothetical protein
MGFYSTTLEPKTAPRKTPSCASKTASREIFSYPIKTDYKKSHNPLKTSQKNRLVTTKTASGIPYWPSRDPITEGDGPNLYAFTWNDPVNSWDEFGYQTRWDIPGYQERWNKNRRKPTPKPTPAPAPAPEPGLPLMSDGSGAELYQDVAVPCPSPGQDVKYSEEETKGYELSAQLKASVKGSMGPAFLAKLETSLEATVGGKKTGGSKKTKDFKTYASGPGPKLRVKHCWCVYRKYKTKKFTLAGITYEIEGPTTGLDPIYKGAVGIQESCPDCPSNRPEPGNPVLPAVPTPPE